MANIESHTEAYSEVSEYLELLKREVSGSIKEKDGHPGDIQSTFLDALEDGILKGTPKTKELIDKLKGVGNIKIKKALFSVVEKNLGEKDTFHLGTLSPDEKVMLGVYVESTLGDESFSFIGINQESQKALLNEGLASLLREYGVVTNAKVEQSLEKIQAQADIDEMKPLKTAEHLQNFVNRLPEIFNKKPMVFSAETLSLLQNKVTREAFQEYFSEVYATDIDNTQNDKIVVALYAMMHLGVQSFPLRDGEGFIGGNFPGLKKTYEKRMEARVWIDGMSNYAAKFKSSDGETLEKNYDSKTGKDFSVLEKPFSEYSKGELGLLLELGNIGQYFLHDSTTWETDFGKISKNLEGREFITNFHDNDMLENTVGLGVLLASKEGPYITVVEVNGKKAVLKMPPEKKELGYYYTDGVVDEDGDSYAEVYTGVRVKILEVSKAIIHEVTTSDGDTTEDVSNEYKGNIESFIDLNRREDIEKYVDERLFAGGLDVAKMKITDLEALKNSGFDIAKLFIRGANGEYLENGVNDLQIGQSYKINIPSKHLERYLSAGLLLAPNIFAPEGEQSTNYINEIEVNGYHGKLDKGAKGKVGFYGEKPDAKANAFDQPNQNKYYRDIYDGDIITIRAKKNIFEDGEVKHDKSFYTLSSKLPDMSNFMLGDGLSLGTSTSSERDKQLILESVYRKIMNLTMEDRKHFNGLIVEEGGIYKITADSLDKGLVYNEDSGSFLMSAQLRDVLLGKDFGHIGEVVGKDFDYKNPPAQFAPEWKKRNPVTDNPWCAATTNMYRMKQGLPALEGNAFVQAMSFLGYKKGKISKYPKGSKSTIKAIIDSEEKATDYIKTSNEVDYFDVFSEGKSEAGKELNKLGPIGVGHVAAGIIINGKAYVADSYSSKSRSGKGKRFVEKEAHPVTGNMRKVVNIKYEKNMLIPWEQYINERKIKRVVFHDAPGIPNSNGDSGKQLQGTDLRGYKHKYPREASLKNNNPSGLTYNKIFASTLDKNGISFYKGSKRPSREGGRYFGFENIGEGIRAHNLLWKIKKKKFANRTTGELFKSWAQDIRSYRKIFGDLWDKKVSDLSGEEFSRIQKNQMKLESGGMYTILKAKGLLEGYHKHV